MLPIWSLLFLLVSPARGGDLYSMRCGQMEVRDYAMGMCMPLAMDGMHMIMARGNGFGVYTTQQGPRGRDDFASPNMFMLDLGRSVESHNYVNLDVMGTLEKWTIPYRGYPELLQFGESNSQGVPFIDAQHPHSSPIMGLTLSDSIRLNDNRDFIKVFFAPRGESTDGPIAFMHRATGIANPDAPLGHHVGQDVGHITSTVLGGSLGLDEFRFEASAFHGEEPEPQKVDLPLGTPNSGAVRFMVQLTPEILAMVSAAYVKSHSINRRYSVSLYREDEVLPGWRLHQAFIYGLVTTYEGASALSSATLEFLLMGERPRFWGRFEFVKRTPAQLAISGPSDQNEGRTVGALTLGYTHRLVKAGGGELGLGGSVTKNLLPGEYLGAYGGNPWTGRIFLQASGMGMWDW